MASDRNFSTTGLRPAISQHESFELIKKGSFHFLHNFGPDARLDRT